MPSARPDMAAIARGWGHNIRQRRLATGWRQRTLAQVIDTDPAQLSRWELGRSVPNDADKLRIAGALGVHPADLFPWPAERPPMPRPKAARKPVAA